MCQSQINPTGRLSWPGMFPFNSDSGSSCLSFSPWAIRESESTLNESYVNQCLFGVALTIVKSGKKDLILIPSPPGKMDLKSNSKSTKWLGLNSKSKSDFKSGKITDQYESQAIDKYFLLNRAKNMFSISFVTILDQFLWLQNFFWAKFKFLFEKMIF